MTFLAIVGSLAGLLLLVALATGGYNLLLTLKRWTAQARHDLNIIKLDFDRERLHLERQQVSNDRERLRITQEIWPDAQGVFPLLWDGVRLLDPNRGAVFTISQGTTALTPALTKPEQLTRMLRATGSWPTGDQPADRLLAEPQMLPQWPEQVQLLTLFDRRQPTIHDLIVGLTFDQTGTPTPVSDSLHNLMHVLTVGASGWGKSTWLRGFLWQIAQAHEPVQIIAIDINGSEFNALYRWNKLRYPVARTPDEAIALLSEVRQEIARRKGLYEQQPTVSNLLEYNRATGQDLPPWIVVADEATNLLNQPGIGEPLRATVQTARQYGIYILLAGQSAKHNVVDTQTRDNFSTRLCFKTSPTSSRVVLDSRAAADLSKPGRAYAQLAGREMVEVLTPLIDKAAFIAALRGHGPHHPMPQAVEAPTHRPCLGRPGQPPTPEQIARILEMSGQSVTVWQIAKDVFGYGTAFYRRKVEQVLSKESNKTNGQQPKQTG